MKILNYRPHNSGCLKGFFDLQVPDWGDFVITGCSHFEKGSKSWFSFPSRKVEKDGETNYYPYTYFANKDMKEPFSAKVMKALESMEPEAPSCDMPF